MGWLKYALAVLLFNALGLLALYALQRLQLWLPLNPQEMANVSPIRLSTRRSVSSPTPTGRAMAANRRWAT
jgi:K+-transporting ATPase A subunit